MRWPFVVLLGLLGCAHHKAEPVGPAAALSTVEDETCPKHTQPLVQLTKRVRGAYQIHRDGTVKSPSGDFEIDELAFEFPRIQSGDIVRVDVGETTIACGALTADDTAVPEYALPNPVDTGAILVVRIYGVDVARNADLAKAKAALIPTLEAVERDEVRRSLDELETANKAFHDFLLDPTNAMLDAAVDSLVAAVQANGASMLVDCSPINWATQPLAEVRCNERQRLQTSLEMLATELRAARPRAWIPAFGAPHPAVRADTVQLAQQLTIKSPLTLDEQEDFCKGVAQLRWLVDVTQPRVIVRHQIPYVASSNLLVAQYGESRDVVAVPASSRLAVLVLGAPVNAPGAFAKRQGSLVSTDIAGLIATALPSFLRGLPSAPLPIGILGFNKLNGSAMDLVRFPTDDFSYACRPGTKTATPSPAGRKLPYRAIDPSVDPLARKESRAFVFGPIGKKYATEVAACEGTSCTANADDKNVRTRVSITPSQSGRFTLLGEFAFGYGIGVAGEVAENSHTCGLRPQSPPKFEPIAGGSGPDQLFELQQSTEPRNAITTSLLFGIRATDRWFLGLGPSLFIGSTGSGLSQWNAHAGYRPLWLPGMYLTFGVSARFVSAPDYYDIGDVVAVPMPPSGVASPPAWSSHQTALFQLDVGLAFDLGAAASTAGSVLSSLGGGK